MPERPYLGQRLADIDEDPSSSTCKRPAGAPGWTSSDPGELLEISGEFPEAPGGLPEVSGEFPEAPGGLPESSVASHAGISSTGTFATGSASLRSTSRGEQIEAEIRAARELAG